MRRDAGKPPDEACRPDAHAREDAGSTLIEVLIALVITSSAIFVLVGGMTTLFTSSIQNRQSTNAGVVARNYAESLEVAVAQASADAVAGVWCSSAYAVTFTPPAGYTVNTPVYGACPTPNATPAQAQFQTVVVSVVAPNGATETLRMVVRQS